MKRFLLLLVLLNLPSYLMAQNLSWEEMVSPKYSYQLPEKEKSSGTTLKAVQRPVVAETENPYNKLLAHREDLKAKIADFEQHQNTEKDKQWLDKYKVSLAIVEKQISEYQAPQKKEKSK